MAVYTIEIPDQLVAPLKTVVERHNANNGVALTVEDYLTLHVKEIAIADDLAAELRALTEKSQKDLQAAGEAARDLLLTGGGK